MPRVGHAIETVCTALSRKQSSPIEVTVAGIVTLVSPVFLNALLLIVFTLDGNSMAVRPVQFSKALEPIEATEDGIVTPLSRVQPVNVLLEMAGGLKSDRFQ